MLLTKKQVFCCVLAMGLAQPLPFRGENQVVDEDDMKVICVVAHDEGARDDKILGEGIPYLKALGSIRANMVPGAWDRISCSWSSGIFVENKNQTEYARPTYETIAKEVEELRSYCHDEPHRRWWDGKIWKKKEGMDYWVWVLRDRC